MSGQLYSALKTHINGRIVAINKAIITPLMKPSCPIWMEGKMRGSRVE